MKISIWKIVYVAPLVGAWIEISVNLTKEYNAKVAPLVGAWIEIIRAFNKNIFTLVAPLVGAWIEICNWN